MSDFEQQLQRFFHQSDEDVTELVDLGDIEGQPVAREEASEELLAFILAGERYLVPLVGVREVVKVPLLTEIPRAVDGLLGLMNLRGELLPVYDARYRLGLIEVPVDLASPDAAPPPREARVVVLHAMPGDQGLLVDRVIGVLRMKPSALSAPGPGVIQAERAAVVALGHHEGALYCLLDARELCT